MPTITANGRFRQLGRHVVQALAGILAGLGIGGSVAHADAPTSRPAAVDYRIVQLSSDPYVRAVMNARGQVAFNTSASPPSRVMFFDGHRFRDFGALGGSSATVAALNKQGQIAFNVERRGVNRAMFYDGRRVLDIGTLGGPGANAAALNELGQVAGTASVDAEGAILHPYRWSRSTGMVDIGPVGLGNVRVSGINNRGQVIGNAEFPGSEGPQVHGFFWSPRSGVLDMGVIGDFSVAGMINDMGTVIGYGGTGLLHIQAFRWTRTGGIGDMGTLPDEYTWSTWINRAGLITGGTPFVAGGKAHPFVYTPGRGLLDLGVGQADRGAALKINEHGMVIGHLVWELESRHGFVWTRDMGLVEFGAGDRSVQSEASDVNNHGQVVGAIGQRAFVWTRDRGMVDLNTVLANAPPGLELQVALQIADSGAILARADSGTYLLLPRGGSHRPRATP